MTLQERIAALAGLGDYIGRMEGRLEFVIRQAKVNNAWFTVENTKKALSNIQHAFLNKEKMEKWVKDYTIPSENAPKKIGLILAGNIPLVGFQDVMNVFAAGHHSVIKTSDKDKHLIPHLIKVLTEIAPNAANYFSFVERMKGFEAIIATGSNNTARYFEAYFGKYPNIIRRNRNSIAIINGSETEEDLRALADDVFTYFGLGCRNVAKIYVPENYDFNQLLEVFHERKKLANHTKYKNNFDYNLAFHILNRTTYYNNGSIVLLENKSLQSRVSQLHYESYSSEEALNKEIGEIKEDIQCIVSNKAIDEIAVLPFGSTQKPSLWDYADGVDAMQFLTGLY